MEKRFEYCVVEIGTLYDRQLEIKLNELANLGWRLIDLNNKFIFLEKECLIDHDKLSESLNNMH